MTREGAQACSQRHSTGTVWNWHPLLCSLAHAVCCFRVAKRCGARICAASPASQAPRRARVCVCALNVRSAAPMLSCSLASRVSLRAIRRSSNSSWPSFLRRVRAARAHAHPSLRGRDGVDQVARASTLCAHMRARHCSCTWPSSGHAPLSSPLLFRPLAGCTAMPQMLHAIVSGVTMAVFVGIGLLLNMAEVETNPTSRRPASLGHSGAEVMAFAVKVRGRPVGHAMLGSGGCFSVHARCGISLHAAINWWRMLLSTSFECPVHACTNPYCHLQACVTVPSQASVRSMAGADDAGGCVHRLQARRGVPVLGAQPLAALGVPALGKWYLPTSSPGCMTLPLLSSSQKVLGYAVMLITIMPCRSMQL